MGVMQIFRWVGLQLDIAFACVHCESSLNFFFQKLLQIKLLGMFILGREGLLHNKPVQGLRLTNFITGITPNQLKIDR